MENGVKNTDSLKERIEFLKFHQTVQLQEFKIASEKFADRISPKTITRNAIQKFSAQPVPNQSPLDVVIGILAGAATNRIYAPKKAGLLRKLTAPVVTYMVANFVKNKITEKRTR
jgi:hypothetical protein